MVTLDPDVLIRRVRFPDHIRKGKVFPKAFKPDRDDIGHGLSVTRCGQSIRTQDDLERYEKEACAHAEVTLGMCFLRTAQVTRLNLLVMEDKIVGQRFGDNHHLIQDPEDESRCPDKDKREQLALLATKNGGMRSPRPLEPS